jgi:hypothetical protein
MIPSQADIEKRQANLAKFLKQIDPVTGKAPEKTMVQVVRSAIRQAWMKSPTKLAYLYQHTEADMDNNTRTKWKVRCEICGEHFKVNEVEIDHIRGNHSFTRVEDFEDYFNNILMVGFDDLQVLCKDGCHAIKTLSERLGITFEEAKVEKEVIEICKTKKDKDFIKKNGLIPESNADKRRAQVRRILSDSTEKK